MKHLDLFSGIGGFAYAIDQVWEGVEHTFCEIDPFCQQVLKKHWPQSKIYGDIKKITWLPPTPTDKRNGEKITRTKFELIGESIGTKTGNPSSLMPEKDQGAIDRNIEKKSFWHMDLNVPVVETQPQNFSTSTTRTTMGILSESNLESQVLINEPTTKDFQTSTNSSAITATLVNQYTEYVHTNEPIDLLTGGFPCQPFSQAGKRKGTGDDRYLWGEMLRAIRETHPRWVIAENVSGLITISNGMVLEQVCTDLEAEGYEVQPFIIPAVSVNAPHRRDRVWIVAKDTVSQRSGGGMEDSGQVLERQSTKAENARSSWEKDWVEVATQFCSLDDGLPVELDGLKLTKPAHRREQLKAYGNAIVPQVAIEILKSITL